MNLKLDMGNLNSVFVVPSSVVDNHIKLAGSLQLKVLLYMLRHAGENLEISKIADALSVSNADVKDAMQYWIETKLINSLEKETVKSCQSLKQNTLEKVNHKDKIDSNNLSLRKKVYSMRPDPKFIVERINGSSEIKYLMQEAQVILSRPISNSDSAALLMLHDVDGLPIDVILMLLQYAVSIGKCNMRYIEKVAMSWGNEEINTVEKAEEKIKSLEKNRIVWNKVRRVLGLENRAPTQKEIEIFNRWINDWNMPEELIKEAYDRCVDLKGKYILSYIDSIIKRFKNNGINNLEQAKLERNNRNVSGIQTDVSPSYNIESYFESMDTFV